MGLHREPPPSIAVHPPGQPQTSNHGEGDTVAI